MNCPLVLVYIDWRRPPGTHCVHVSDHHFVEHCAGASLVNHFEKSKILLHGSDLWRRPFSVLNHPLKECFEMCCSHVRKCFFGIAESRVEAKTACENESARELSCERGGTVRRPLPSPAKVLHAGLRCMSVWLDMAAMSFEAMDDCAPVFSALWPDRHVWRAIVGENDPGAREAPSLYIDAVRRLAVEHETTRRETEAAHRGARPSSDLTRGACPLQFHTPLARKIPGKSSRNYARYAMWICCRKWTQVLPVRDAKPQPGGLYVFSCICQNC